MTNIADAAPHRLITYACNWCPEVFTNPAKYGGHVRMAHPKVKGKRARSINWPAHTPFTPRGPRPGGTLKRDTDIWPGRP